MNILCRCIVTPRILGAQWLSGRVLDSRPRVRGFEPQRRHCVVSLSKNIYPSLVLVQPRKTRPFITERFLMGRKESNHIKSNLTKSNKNAPYTCSRLPNYTARRYLYCTPRTRMATGLPVMSVYQSLSKFSSPETFCQVKGIPLCMTGCGTRSILWYDDCLCF